MSAANDGLMGDAPHFLVRVLMILFGVAWVAYAKSLVFLWGFKRYGGFGPIEQPTYINAHD